MTRVDEKFSVDRQALEAKALRAMFDGFAAKNLSYAVLRNYKHLPESIGARDIDILVAPADLGAALEVICDLARDLNLMFANFYRDERIVQFALVRRLNKGMLFDLKVDLFTNSQVYGVEAISASVMLEDHRTYNGILVVADDVLLLDKWLFHLVVGQPVHAKYDSEFARIGTSLGLKLLQVLSPLVGRKKAEALVAEVAAGRTSETAALSRYERLVLLARLWKRQGLAALPRTLMFLWQRFRNRFRPHGIFLSLSGPDGCGKTTVIEHLVAQLGQVYGGENLEYRHFRPTVLPRIAEVARAAHAIKTVDVDYWEPHRAHSSGPIGSIARLGYYWLDYVVGYVRSVHSALVERKVVLFDRYYFDMISDPGRSRIALPMGLLRFVARLLPLPRFAFFIRVSSEEVFRRKQELSLMRIRELNDRYEYLVRRGMLLAVDNDGAAAETAAAQIVDTIITQRDLKARQALGKLCR